MLPASAGVFFLCESRSRPVRSRPLHWCAVSMVLEHRSRPEPLGVKKTSHNERASPPTRLRHLRDEPASTNSHGVRHPPHTENTQAEAGIKPPPPAFNVGPELPSALSVSIFLKHVLYRSWFCFFVHLLYLGIITRTYRFHHSGGTHWQPATGNASDSVIGR